MTASLAARRDQMRPLAIPNSAIAKPILSVRRLAKSFGGLAAVSELDFDVPQGSVYALIGPNGAGKTTVFNLITGVYRPTSGAVALAGDKITGLPQHEIALRGVARTFQNLQIFFNMSAVENVMVGANRFVDQNAFRAMARWPSTIKRDRACRERAIELMRRVGLERFIGAATDAMPYGALKRLEIARALASEPKILILDEPAAGLTGVERAHLVDLIDDLARGGPTIILVEHDMKLVMSVSQRILVLAQGKKLAEGEPDDIKADPKVIEAYLGAAEEQA